LRTDNPKLDSQQLSARGNSIADRAPNTQIHVNKG